jgi:hypothetical protein
MTVSDLLQPGPPVVEGDSLTALSGEASADKSPSLRMNNRHRSWAKIVEEGIFAYCHRAGGVVPATTMFSIPCEIHSNCRIRRQLQFSRCEYRGVPGTANVNANLSLMSLSLIPIEP